MQLIERFQAEGTDGRIVEILKWAPAETTEAIDEPIVRDRMREFYSTLQGRRVVPEPDGDWYSIPSVGLMVRRRPGAPRTP